MRSRGVAIEIAFGILASFIQLLVIGGVVFFIVKAVSGRGKATEEGVGVMIRRFFQYAVMLAMLVLVSVGIAGLIDAIITGGDQIAPDSTGIARSIAFVFVGLPVFVGLGLYTSRRLKLDPREQKSAGWATYLTVALVGSLVTAMSLFGAFLSELLEDRTANQTDAIYALTFLLVWIAHWWVAQRKGWPDRLHAHLLLGSAAGMIATFVGVAIGTSAAAGEIYHRLFQTSIVDGGIEPLATSFIILVVGAPVWWWYWFRHGRHLDRGALWLTYVLLLGVLSGAVAGLSGAGVMLYGVIEWILGDPVASSASEHFAFIPAALGTLVAGGVIWWYHGSLVGDRGDRERTEVDRVYDYLLAATGLAVAASGVSTVLTIALNALGGRAISSFDTGNATAVALTLLVIGTPLWWRYWSTIQGYRTAEPERELRSITRRVYLFMMLGVAGTVAVINLIVVIFLVFDDILEGRFGAATLDSAAVPVALLLTSGAIAWYHGVILREDRAAPPAEEVPVLRRVVVLGTDARSVALAVKERTGAAVTGHETAPEASHASTLEQVLETLETAPYESAAVVETTPGAFTITPIKTDI